MIIQGFWWQNYDHISDMKMVSKYSRESFRGIHHSTGRFHFVIPFQLFFIDWYGWTWRAEDITGSRLFTKGHSDARNDALFRILAWTVKAWSWPTYMDLPKQYHVGWVSFGINFPQRKHRVAQGSTPVEPFVKINPHEKWNLRFAKK